MSTEHDIEALKSLTENMIGGVDGYIQAANDALNSCFVFYFPASRR